MAKGPWTICHQPSALSHDPFLHSELDSSYAQRVAVAKMAFRHAPAVHERAVRALQIHDFQFVGAGGDPAVQPRDERGVDDEICAWRAPDGFHCAGPQPKGRFGFGTPKDPHGATFYPRASSHSCMVRTKSGKGVYIRLGAALPVLGAAPQLAPLDAAVALH